MLSVYVRVWGGLFSLHTEQCQCMFSPACDCPWRIQQSMSTHLTVWVCVSAAQARIPSVLMHTCACMRAWMWVCLRSCYPGINNSIQPYYEWAEQSDTDCEQGADIRRQKHMRSYVSASTLHVRAAKVFRGQDGYAWPQSIQFSDCCGKAGGQSHATQPAPEQFTAASGAVVCHRVSEIMSYVTGPIGEYRWLVAIHRGAEGVDF